MGLEPYAVLVTIDALQIQRPSSKNRELILRYLESLAKDPFAKGDYEEQDATGRTVQIKIVGDYALTFWADHPVREIKVVKFETADRF